MRKTVIRVRRRVGVNEKEEKRGISELVRIVCESIIWYIYIYVLDTSSKGIKKGDYSVIYVKAMRRKKKGSDCK